VSKRLALFALSKARIAAQPRGSSRSHRRRTPDAIRRSTGRRSTPPRLVTESKYMSTARTPLETAMLLDDQKGEARISPRFDQMDRGAPAGRAEDTPAYIALRSAGVLCTEHRRKDIEDIFTGLDLKQNTDQWKNIVARAKNCCCIVPCAYYACHTEMFVPAGHVGFLMDQQNRYLFAQPGMHNINSMFIRVTSEPRPLRGHIKHGNRTIVVVDQGSIGYASDNGQPVLLPPGIHVWTSESMDFVSQFHLNDHIIELGPYTLVTVNEGYSAVTQNNGKQVILAGGHTHFLTHKNWKFEKFITLKIQTDELERIQATSADNINMLVNSTVNWRIVDVEVAATMAAETMAQSGKGKIAADISKLRRDVLKQALASLAAFIGSVNYSESFHMSAAAQAAGRDNTPVAAATLVEETPATVGAFADNPLYNLEKMGSAVEHANSVTRSYGIEIMSINIISAAPVDDALTKSLASGAVASAEALMAETTARGQSRAVTIAAEADAAALRIRAEADAEAEKLRAEGRAEGLKAVSDALTASGGEQAMVQNIAEKYIASLSTMANTANMIIVPDKPNDVSGVVTTALALGKQVAAKA
jgi:regulator of protease activity HflC (stomatin/prohibitin superfamily)